MAVGKYALSSPILTTTVPLHPGPGYSSISLSIPKSELRRRITGLTYLAFQEQAPVKGQEGYQEENRRPLHP